MLQYWRDACKVVNPQSEDNTESTLPAKFQIAVLGSAATIKVKPH